MTTFETAYTTNLWDGLSLNQRTWYVPDLLSVWRRKSVYRAFVPVQVDLSAQRTRTMIFNLVFDYEPNINAIGDRDLYTDALYTDSAQLTITTERHAGKVQYHKYDDMITYWRENGVSGLARIVRERLAPAMTRHFDLLARNAFLASYQKSYALDPANSGFNDIVAGDTFDKDWIERINLMLATADAPGFGESRPGELVCITSPSTYYILRNDSDFIDWNRYANPTALFSGEVGTYRGVRFITSNDAILHNAGTITKQVTVTTAINEGDGAAATYRGYTIGQSGAVHTVTCSDFAPGDFVVGDTVTIHSARTSSYGVTNGVDPYHGKTFQRVVVAVDATANTLSFDRPIMHPFTTEITTGVYAYITKGLNVHTSTFIAGPGGVVAGVTQPPTLYTDLAQPDDFKSIYRFTWDAWLKYQPFRPEWVVPVFHAGYHSNLGGLQTGA